ncbi:hypothetical protein K435DRAFT_774195 [Dendrothele bispora CBS 962.96]|uniref:BZIP domain-containing protein n=1 Tax=Dendrothele bispora (strain CBS 962.96) TaxID=1314807 RepID=A0A4S8MPK2_DENBC|nr:hypothetical protein K435DRAFT_774195 [Dendrothele bispora CBS 962.96]
MSPKDQLTDIALRKKKNADAQAAFRARRANYISTLEETVTNLESVVLQLQDSCRESRSEAQELRQENARLRQALRDRENFWRAVWPRKGQSSSDSDDFPPTPPTFNSQLSVTTQYSDPSLSCSNQYPSPATSYPIENDPLGGHRSAPKYTQYPWPQPITQSSSSSGMSGVPTTNSSNSPDFSTESPTVNSSDMSFIGRFPQDSDEQKVSMNAPYVGFPSSRSISPSSSTPSSSTPTSVSSSFHFNFSEGSAAAVHDRSQDFDYRRQATQHPPEVTLHGGTADISLAASGADGVRYRLGSTSTARSPTERGHIPILPPLSAGSDNGSQHELGSSDGGGGGDYPPHKLRSRRGTGNNHNGASSRNSRSPSPGVAPLSGTLAVIKAQAFGALRRTRVRSKRPADGAAKVAMDVLESRGIMGAQAGVKRQRLNDDDDDFDVPS